MPNMDGTGPRGLGRLTGLGLGSCRGSHIGSTGGRRVYGRGLGICRFAKADSKESLTVAKTALQQRISAIEDRLKEL